MSGYDVTKTEFSNMMKKMGMNTSAASSSPSFSPSFSSSARDANNKNNFISEVDSKNKKEIDENIKNNQKDIENNK